MFLALDADDDGELSAKEIAGAAKALLKLDRNKDGILTEDEVRPPRPGGRRGPGGPGGPPGGPDGPGGPPGGGPGRGPARGGPDGALGNPGGPGGRGNRDPKAMVDNVMSFDKDGNGKVTEKELPERMANLLDEADANKDGSLDRAEVEAYAAKRPARRPGGPGGPPPGGPDNL
jgi:hypothetical protein